jgi:tRNA modification GTPase
MPGPASYTGEDVVEIHLPGSPLVLETILALLQQGGARPAAPGEFTFRAFRNGRLSLSQAEAVEELIRSGNAQAAQAALARLNREGPARAALWREEVLRVASLVEAALDFGEEELSVNPLADLNRLLSEISQEADFSVTVETGLAEVALLGQSNAGKSSLFNALLSDPQAALVSSDLATTHDYLRREVEWAGTRLVLSDNPGHQAQAKGVDQLVSQTALARLGLAALAVWVVDASLPLGREDTFLASRLREGRVLVALNKIDLPGAFDPEELRGLARREGLDLAGVHPVSALSGEGVAELRETLAATAAAGAVPEGFNHRERLELAEARQCCQEALAELNTGGRLELVAECLRGAAEAFSRTMGEGYAEAALGRIFARFCLGK